MNVLLKTALALSLVELAACSTPAVRPKETAPRQPAAATPKAAAATPIQCTDPIAPAAGPNGFYCVDTDLISEKSYCLRDSNHHAEHVRGLKGAGALETYGVQKHATLEPFRKAKKGEPCYDPNFPDLYADGDYLIITKNGNGLTMQIVDRSVKPPRDRFTPALDLKPDPKNGSFYWTGSYDGIDYFVMLADNKLGQMGRADSDGVKRIEHYFRIEAFKQSYPPTSACYQSRPDYPASSATGLNFFEWKRNEESCDLQPTLQQNGTGSGGHNYP
jgi:hypothetical protein